MGWHTTCGAPPLAHHGARPRRRPDRRRGRAVRAEPRPRPARPRSRRGDPRGRARSVRLRGVPAGGVRAPRHRRARATPCTPRARAAWWRPRAGPPRFRDRVEAVAARAGLAPDLLEAIVFLESAGRPGAIADPKLEGAVGLTQILAETGRNLLGMKIDVRASRKLTRRIGRAERAGDERRAREAARAAGARRPALRPAQGAGGHRPLPHAVARAASAATTSRWRRTTWASATWSSVIRDFGGAAQLRRALLRRQPHGALGRLAAAVRPRRRLVDVPLARVRGAGDHARLPRGSRRAGARRRSLHGEELGRGGAPPRGRHGGLRRPGRARGRLPRRRGQVVPATPRARSGLRRDRGWASWRSAWSASGGSTAACARRHTR